MKSKVDFFFNKNSLFYKLEDHTDESLDLSLMNLNTWYYGIMIVWSLVLI